jgi:hypothetical protein
MKATNDIETVPSTEYKHEDACSLFNPRHEIPTDAADVLDYLNEMDGVRAVAGGCGTCAAHALHTDDDTECYVHYTAQNTSDLVFVGYGTGEDNDTDARVVAHLVMDVCDQLGVPADWTGDTAQTVCIGDEDYYSDE